MKRKVIKNEDSGKVLLDLIATITAVNICSDPLL